MGLNLRMFMYEYNVIVNGVLITVVGVLSVLWLAFSQVLLLHAIFLHTYYVPKKKWNEN